MESSVCKTFDELKANQPSVETLRSFPLVREQRSEWMLSHVPEASSALIQTLSVMDFECSEEGKTGDIRGRLRQVVEGPTYILVREGEKFYAATRKRD